MDRINEKTLLWVIIKNPHHRTTIKIAVENCSALKKPLTKLLLTLIMLISMVFSVSKYLNFNR